jgi:hypothetical protein
MDQLQSRNKNDLQENGNKVEEGKIKYLIKTTLMENLKKMVKLMKILNILTD